MIRENADAKALGQTATRLQHHNAVLDFTRVFHRAHSFSLVPSVLRGNQCELTDFHGNIIP